MSETIACCTAPVDSTDPDVLVGYFEPPTRKVAACDGAVSTALGGQFYTLAGVGQGQTLPAGWFPCGTRPGVGGGGGGGAGAALATVEFTWQQGTFEDAGAGSTAWPDGGALATVNAEHWTPAPIAGSYTAWQCIGVVVVLHNVAGATSGDVVVVLQDDAGTPYATVTIASGTSPDAPGTQKGIYRSVAATGTAGAGTRLQWVIQDAPAGNDFWCEAFALGVLS